MDALVLSAGHRMNHVHFAAISTATAQLWVSVRQNIKHASHSGIDQKLQFLYKQCVQGLQPLLADMAAQEISNVLWSSAKLGLTPDEFVPDMVHALTTSFLELIDLADKTQQPKAQFRPDMGACYYGTPSSNKGAAGFTVLTLCLPYLQLRCRAMPCCTGCLQGDVVLGHIESHSTRGASAGHTLYALHHPAP